jgi:glutamate decarboxylase
MKRLFGAYADGWFDEKEADPMVSAMIRGFLQSEITNSSVEVETLVEGFKSSRIPEGSCDIEGYLSYLFERVVSHSTRTASPRFIGHMTTALPYFTRLLGRLVVALNQNAVKTETAKSVTAIEREALAMLHRLIYGLSDDFYDLHIQRAESTLGMVVSGGTVANITALWCARNRALGPKGGFTGVESGGMVEALDRHGYTGAVVIGSSLMHYSFEKAAGLMGIGTDGIIKIAVTPEGRIETRLLRQKLEECRDSGKLVIAIVGIAGTTDCGSIDPLVELADIAQEGGIAFHVDAAWGGPLLFSRRHKHMLAGIERADSVTVDGHKQLYLPMGIGMVLLRDPQSARAIEKQANYIVRAGSFDLGRRSLEGSRPAMSVFLHAGLNIIGARGYEYLIDEGIQKAGYMADLVRASEEFELLAEPSLNILTYRYIPQKWRKRLLSDELSLFDNESINKFNERLQVAQRERGRTFISRTTLNSTRYGDKTPIVALRAVIANPLTNERDIEAVLDDQASLARSIAF